MELLNEELIQKCAKVYQTPFHIYSEKGIVESCRSLRNTFDWAKSYKNFYSVTANPNPHILDIILHEEGCVECSSLTELEIANSVGFKGENIIFTSNETSLNEYKRAIELGAIVNLDDLSHLMFLQDRLKMLPKFLSFRLNPGPEKKMSNLISKDPIQSKVGMTRNQIMLAFKIAKHFGGVEKFGLHIMSISNCQNPEEIEECSKLLFSLAVDVFKQTGINVDLINIGGGFGIKYNHDTSENNGYHMDHPLDLKSVRSLLKKQYESQIIANLPKVPVIATECGRFVLGPNGALVTKVLHQKRTYKNYIGVDACMSNLMTPGLYNAYHSMRRIPFEPKEKRQKHEKSEISLLDEQFDSLPLRERDLWNGELLKNVPSEILDSVKQEWESNASLKSHLHINEKNDEDEVLFDVVGSLCENNDKFAIDRSFIKKNIPRVGDLLLIRDTGAHGACMGFQYNGKLRSAEILVNLHGDFLLIRRKEEIKDFLATVTDTTAKNISSEDEMHSEKAKKHRNEFSSSKGSHSYLEGNRKRPPLDETDEDHSSVIKDSSGRIVKEAIVEEANNSVGVMNAGHTTVAIEEIMESPPTSVKRQ